MSLQLVTELFRRKARESAAAADADPSTILATSYEHEVQAIQARLEQQRTVPFIAPLSRRAREPAVETLLYHWREASKRVELNLRHRELERLDGMYERLWKALGEGGRTHVSAEEYRVVMRRVMEGDEEPAAKEDDHPSRATGGESSGGKPAAEFLGGVGKRTQGASNGLLLETAGGGNHPPDTSASPESSLACTPSRARSPGPSASFLSASDSNWLGRGGEPTGRSLAELLYLPCIPFPEVNWELLLGCPVSTDPPHRVHIVWVQEAFARKVALVKCETELMICDTDHDGKLTEDEFESYVADLARRIPALRDLSDEDLPFYCCTVTRRIFWELDQGNRGCIHFQPLLQSTVMEAWVALQIQTEDNPTSWFGALATQQIYTKFLLLDTRNSGTLNAANLKRYKKGLPTVIDDGLPVDVSPLSSLFIDRFFETNPTTTTEQDLDYRRFVDFVIAVETLPECARPLFWWNIFDLDGSGCLTPVKANFFFKETRAKLVEANLEVPSVETIIEEVFDLIPSAEPLCITREEYVRAPQAGLFAALLIDCLSFWVYESREHR